MSTADYTVIDSVANENEVGISSNVVDEISGSAAVMPEDTNNLEESKTPDNVAVETDNDILEEREVIEPVKTEDALSTTKEEVSGKDSDVLLEDKDTVGETKPEEKEKSANESEDITSGSPSVKQSADADFDDEEELDVETEFDEDVVSKSPSPSDLVIAATGEEEQAETEMKNEWAEQFHRAVAEHKIARETNLQLQTKLAEYFRRKKADAAEQQSGASSMGGSTTDNVVDYEQRYNKYITSLTDLRNQYENLQLNYKKQIDELKAICSERQKEVDAAFKEFTDYKFSVGKKALHSKTGRPINSKELLEMLNVERKKEAVVMEVRLENIKLRNEVAKVEAILKSKEELAEGLHLIDFEQLKIENQTYNEKIEERNQELEKLKRKIASTVQIMTHVKEKLEAVQFDNEKRRERLGIADAELTYIRDQLNKLKHYRDRLRADNVKLRRSCGLLGKTALLLNYEDSVEAVQNKRAALEETKKATNQYINKTKNLLSKIECRPSKTSTP